MYKKKWLAKFVKFTVNISLERNPKTGSSRLFMESKSENSAISGIQLQILL